MHTIYLITCKENGMRYVGQTTQGIKNRWYDHCKRSRNKKDKEYNLPLKKDIRKYGKDNFVVEELAFTEDNTTADYLEEYYIRLMNLVEDGYNQTYGRGQKGVELSDHTKELLRRANVGREKTEEEIRAISERQRGECNTFYGKHHSEKTKEILRRKKSKRIRCVETGDEFMNLQEATLWLGFKSISAINNALRGRTETAGGYHWQYAV